MNTTTPSRRQSLRDSDEDLLSVFSFLAQPEIAAPTPQDINLSNGEFGDNNDFDSSHGYNSQEIHYSSGYSVNNLALESTKAGVVYRKLMSKLAG